ncbi:MAG: DUF1249 domain-containing protein [Gammaproteobacteria bacterium]
MRLPLTKQEKYVPNLNQLMRLCTVNYIQLLKLFPCVRQFQKGEQKQFCLAHSQGAVVTCTVTEAAPYTTFLTFTQEPQHVPREEEVAQDVLMSLFLTIRVRLYHDAQLAEVVDAQQDMILPGRCAYPNSRLFQVDEKAQSNRFFSEWLTHCKKHGLAISTGSSIYY